MRASVIFSCAAVCLALAGCGPADSGKSSQTGGTASSGGATSTGGTTSSGGTTGSGGALSTGGTTATGGASGSGGDSDNGGTTGSGGTTRSGGSSGSGGATGSGGTSDSGGTTSRGGVSGSGGTTGSGGASGGTTAPGGATGSGGSSSGGLTGTGDASATGGAGGRDASSDTLVGPDTAPACTPGEAPCTEADKTVTSGSGQHCCYTYENWVGSGSATMTLKTDGFSVSWTGSTQFVGREGIRPGSGNLVTQYSATFNPNGNSYLCLYGWTTEPLAEYYVVDGWGSWRPPGGSALGTVTSDGGTYDIYKSTRTNQPSIIGTATFPQYWSVRQQKKTSGTITLANHITAWAAKGMPMGTFYEVSMTVEGYQSNGSADVKFSMK